MTIIVLGVLWVALTDGPVGEQPFDERTSTSSSEQPAGERAGPGSSGVLIPRERPAMSPSDSTAALPEDLPIIGEIIKNYTTPIGAGTQQVIITESGQSQSDVAAQYRTWLTESTFTLSEEGGAEDSVVLKTAGPDADATLDIVITGGVDTPVRIQLNYISGR